MPQYMLSIHHDDDYAPGDEEMTQIAAEVEALNKELAQAGIEVFGGGLHPASTATVLRVGAGGEVLVTDGPYLETKEHIGGFWVIRATDLDEALDWGRKATRACHLPVEVRPFHTEAEQ